MNNLEKSFYLSLSKGGYGLSKGGYCYGLSMARYGWGP